MWSLFKFVFILLTAILVNGCGYTLNHRLKDAFVNSKGIFVPVFANSTEEMGVEMIFTNALIRELGLHGEVVLTSREKSGLELRGLVERIGYQPSAVFFGPTTGDPQNPKERNRLQPYSPIPDQIGVSATISMQLLDSETKKVLWSKTASAARTASAFLDRTGDLQAASSNGLITQSLIDSKYNDIARDLVRDMYDEMVELF